MKERESLKIETCKNISFCIGVKGGYAHFNMYIFHFYLIDLDLRNAFLTFHPEVASCLPSRGIRKYSPLGMRLI